MATEITIALIGIVGTILTSIGTLIGVIVQNKNANRSLIDRSVTAQAVFEAKVNEKIEMLTSEVKRHNAVIERTYKLETQQKVQDEKIASLENKLAGLERRS